MNPRNRRQLLLACGVLSAVFVLAGVASAGEAGFATAAAAPCAPSLEELLAARPAACTAADAAPAEGVPGVLPLQPHCCSQQEVDACRSNCKAQGPGCKGQIGCRAGECVCTCNCP